MEIIGDTIAIKTAGAYVLRGTLTNARSPVGNLLANSADTTVLRNESAFKMGSILDAMAWTPRSDKTVLYLNGEYPGVYQLTEAIKVNADRVNASPAISKSNPNGGYILEIDKFYKGEAFHIETAIKQSGFPVPIRMRM
ncbi:MAG: CotH kinase family protein [Treponema sp.]|nr:CotH kinase family protein [Treponema sp.]